MNLTQIAFTYRKLIFLILATLLLYGAVSYFTLPAREDPRITIREAVVVTQYPGLNPERVEDLITKKLERAIRQIPEIEEIRSTSSTGLSVIHVEILDRYKDLVPIWQNLRNKVREAYASLPEGTRPSIINDEFGDVSMVTLALTAPDYEMSLMYDIAKHARDVLYTVEGTKKIDIMGVQEERIFLEISNARLSQLGISPQELAQILSAQNIIQPGGSIDTGIRSYVVEPTGNFDRVADIGGTLISIPGTDGVFPLSDIVSISRAYVDPPIQPAYFNGEPAIMFAISMLEGYNALEFSPRVKGRVSELQATLPVGMFLSVATYQADHVAKTVYGVSLSVLQTLIIVLVVVMIFLGIRTGLIVGAIVPFVMLTTLSLMNIFGLELERMSLATLIISLGLLVDNGIVIAEDFKRRLETGTSREDALRECGAEMDAPLLISTLTTILVFLPLMLAEHVAGEYTRTISLVIMISLLTSWVLALCVTPTLCYYFLTVDPKINQQVVNERQTGLIGRLYGPYEKLLHWAMCHQKSFMAIILGVFAGSILMMGLVPQQFFADSDRSQILVYTELPTSTTTRATNRRIQDVFEFLDDRQRFPHIESHAGYVGFGGPRFVASLAPEDPADNRGFVVLNIGDFNGMDQTIDELRVGFREQFPDMFVRVTKMFLGTSDSSTIEVQIKGPDSDVLYENAESIKALLRSMPGVIDVRSDWETRIVKAQVQVDQKRARRAGVTSEDIAVSMSGGIDGLTVTEFREGDDVIPVIFRGNSGERFSIDRLRTLNVFSTARQTNVPLFQIADFKAVNQFAKIERENMFRTISIEAKTLDMTAEDLKVVVDPMLQDIAAKLPPAHIIEYDGVISESADAQAALSANVPVVLGLIVVLLVAQFNSYKKPAIIMLTIPLMMIGASLGLLITGSFFGFMVTLGLYSLAGIIINNAIVLIDRIEIEAANDKSQYDAIVDACMMRLRPIAMTTITTVLGLLPLILSRDPLFYGMSNAMAFGLAVGTILTLGVVPVLFGLFHGVRKPEAA
ncbi:MAG: efflux RND transporter permease subunit [Pseudomonadota bacterium]